MDKFYLEKVTPKRKNDIIEYIRELYKFGSIINGVGRLQDYVTEDNENFDDWFKKIKKEENEEFHKTCFLFIRENDDKLIGMLNIRICEDLKDYPYGHIGYSIRPLERNKGYGKIQFFLALEELKKNNIKTCQMNCESCNDASRKVILSLGGVFEKNIDCEEYYLIDIYKAIKENNDKYSSYEKIIIKPIIVTTLCDKKEIADKIKNILLKKRLISGCQISERKSTYWWNDAIEEAIEFHLEMRSKENLFDKIKETILEINDYDVCEISYYEIKGANRDFLEWIENETI